MKRYSFLVGIGVFFLVAVCTVLAGAANFSGSWNTSWNSDTKFTRLNATQSANKISGHYNFQGGQISGTVDKNVVGGSWWQEDGKRGSFKFVISADGESFKGKWKNASSKDWDGTWNGTLRR